MIDTVFDNGVNVSDRQLTTYMELDNRLVKTFVFLHQNFL